MPTEYRSATVPHVPRRIHIVPIGFEEDRVVLPAVELKAEKVFLLANLPKNDRAGKFRTEVIRRLKEVDIEHEVRTASIFALDETLDLIVRLLRENRRESLFINLSAGSKIQALAGCLAAMIARAEGISVCAYYVEPKRYKDDPPKTPLSFGLEQLVEIPPLILPTPPMEVKVAMRLLSRRDYSKLELALVLAASGQLDPSKVGRDGTPVNERARVSLQSSVDFKVVQPLVSVRYASTQKKGKRVIVSLTESGRQAASLLTAGMGDVDMSKGL
jgi:hypothetical protein